MKKIVLFGIVLSVCAIAYFSMSPEEEPYLDESDAQVYLETEPEEGEYLNESEVLAYLNLGLQEEPHDTRESDAQAYTPAQKRYHAVKHYKPRISTLGFSIIPPPGSNWYEKLEADSLFYVKINKLHKKYAILTEAREVHLNTSITDLGDIQAYVKKEKEMEAGDSHFKEPNLTVQIAESRTEKCVRYSQYYQDHGMKGLREQQYVNVDTHGLFCLHPHGDRVAIDINYVEKSLSDTSAKSYSNEGEKFLASLKFQ